MTAVTNPVFASVANLYLEAGWPAVLPVPAETKTPPPTGYTGYEGKDTPAELVGSWIANGYAYHSVALRMPDGIIGIDVDDYITPSGKVKTGAQTLAKSVERWGELPPTWSSTARGEGPSRIRFYRVPPGRYATVIQPHIEIIQWFHRYAVVWPSPHTDLGTTYLWYTPDGAPADRVPQPDELPELPASWVSGLAEGASAPSPASASHASGEALLAALRADARPACAVMFDALDAAARVLDNPDVGTRHDAMTARVHRIVQTAAFGHPGFGAALPALHARWEELTAGENREGEFERMLLSSARKAVTALNGVQQLSDPCLMLGGPEWAGMAGMTVDARPRPVDDRQAEEGEDLEPLHLELPPKLVDPSWPQVVGADPFDPGVDLDHLLADAMLRRTYYMVRRASDAKSAWLQRGAEQWSLEGDLSGRIVSECASLMPDGDPEPVIKGQLPTPEQRAFKRRVRMMTNGPASAVAATIRRHTDGGRHPATVRLADLDQEPEVLWAGGWPYDLRASKDMPILAETVDPYGPHLVAAGVTPALVPTPRWNAYLAAVWPDEAVRAWALRVLSIAVTGYADAALPILFGAGGTGKTSLIILLMEVLGSYAHAANPKLLSDKADQFMAYQLKGRRLSFIDEAMREGQRNAETLKQLTGGGPFSGAAKYQNEISFRGTHTLVLTSNTEPSVHDQALRRRVRLLPCNGDPDEVRARRQALTGRHWAAEAPGVLALMMREAAAWLADPDSALTANAPLAVQFAMGELIASQDIVSQWLAEAVEPNPHGTRSHQLYVWFRGWCRDTGVRDGSIPSETAWGTALNEAGFTVIKRRDANYRGLIIRQDPGPGSYPQPVHGPATSAPAGGGLVEGTWRVGGGSEAQPSTEDNTRSGTVFAPSVEGVEGRFTTYKNETAAVEGYIQRTESGFQNTLQPSTPSTPDDKGAGVEGCGGLGPTPHTPSNPPHQGGSPLAPVSPRSVTKTEAARRADEAKITKAEARRQLAEEKRLAAIEAASGEHVGLPAVATREGHVLAVTEDQAAAIVRTAMGQAGALTVDVETSGYPVGHVHHVLRTVQLGGDEAAVVLDPARHADLIRTLLAEAPRLHAHSAPADLVPLAHAGLIDADAGWARMYDTVIPAKLADPQSTGSDPGLKKLAAAVLGAAAAAPGADEAREALFKAGKWLTRTQLDSPWERSGWAQVDPQCATMLRYAASDVLDTAGVARTLPAIPPAVLERERLAEAMTARVTHRGLRIDADRVRILTAEHTRLRDEAGARVRAYGIDNPGSGPQVATALQALGAALPTSDKGNPSVAEHVLTVLKRTAADTPAGQLAAAVLDYRHSATVLGLFLAPYAQLCDLGDGRARPTIYTLGTDTGRMSAVRPNVQQLPREGGVRSIYVADPGHVFISADFSGVELRVAAALSQDPTMLQLLAEGRDLHAEVAALAFGEGWTKADRYMAKRGVFGFMYGGGVATLARQVGTTETEMAAVVDSLKVLTPAYQEWSEQIRRGVRQGHTQFPTYSGRIVHLPVQYPHKSPNYCVGMNTPVLRSDLQHVAASKIQVGDRLVAFDEHPQDGVGGQNRYHHLRTAVVEAVSTVVKPSLRVRTADGKTTECSTDHLWLARRLKGRKNNRPRVRWMRADELQPGDDLLSLGTWEVADSRSAGYGAGLYDGEGSLSRHDGVRRKNQLFFSQNRGIVMDAMQASMDELGLPYSYYHRAPNSTSTTDTVVVSGLRNVMRTLGTLQPARFRPRFEALYEGNAITAGLTESVAVTAIEDAGEMELAAIQTSTRTLIANGYLSHNCIQGTAREALVDALIRWRDTRWGDATLLPVHDELVIQVPEQDAETATAELVRCMEGSLYGVRIAAEASRPSAFWQDSV